MENLSRYIIQACIFQERIKYLPKPSKMVYRAKDGTEEKVLDAVMWLDAMGCHIPDCRIKMVRYYGYYTNFSRGKRKETKDDRIPSILQADQSSKE